MSNWYYADAERQRQGPLSADDIAQRFHQGKLRLDTLVWRDGLADWQPLRDFTSELALHQTPAETFYTAVDSATAPDDGFDTQAATGITPEGGTQLYADNSASPYAPPAAPLLADEVVHAGGEVVYAGLWKRLAASILDSFVTTAAVYAILIPMMLLMGVGLSGLAGTGSNPLAGGMSVAMTLMIYPIYIFIPALYFGWMQSSSRQASLGKMAVGIKVVRTDGSRSFFWRSFLRYVAYVVFTIVTCGLGVLISGLMTALTQRKQALHDMICDTLVVDQWAFTAHPEWQNRELGTVTIVILAIFGLLLLGMIALIAVAVGVAASAGNWR